MTLPVYSEIHVISDLHMGGKSGFQILRETTRLANFIRWVGTQRPGEKVALILNGDIIDTLAEEVGGAGAYVAVHNAVEVVGRIMEDKSFAPVWAALADFVKLDNRTLVIVLGNHDIELAFPTVQHLILDKLTGNGLSARARVEFSTAGAGYACKVGKARVFCTHGNEVDAWNFIRYEDLGKAARRINANRPLPPSEWVPNAGTKLVKDVMNTIKGKYAWIDLLKPETSAAVGVLAALDPGQLSKLPNIIPIVGKKALDSREVNQRLSADGFEMQASPQSEMVDSPTQILGPNLMRGATPTEAAKRIKAKKILLDAEENYSDRALDSQQPPGTLGYGQLAWDRLTGWLSNVSKEEALRRALQDWLSDDKTFEITDKDELFDPIVNSIGSDIDFLVTGHTHLARAVEMGSNRFYFNCGTWIRLLRITKQMLTDEDSFRPVYQVLEKGDMASIDAAKFGTEHLILDRTSAVRISMNDNGTVTGELANIKGDQNISREDVVKTFVWS